MSLHVSEALTRYVEDMMDHVRKNKRFFDWAQSYISQVVLKTLAIWSGSCNYCICLTYFDLKKYILKPNLKNFSLTLVSWGSEATPSATPFFKRAYKISHLPRLWVFWIDLPSFASLSKIWPNFNNKVFFSWSYKKIMLAKNVCLTYYSSMKKKIQRDSDDFWHW